MAIQVTGSWAPLSMYSRFWFLAIQGTSSTSRTEATSFLHFFKG